MTFQLVYYSQQDPKWKEDILGFGSNGDTIGYVGCALTSVAMLLSGHGHTETPKSLNQKLKNVGGFAGAAIRWGAVSQLYPQVTVKSNISCTNTDAPLGLIDASIAAGQPVIVMVDSTPATGLLTHWVVLYAREGNDYLMLDPWPYQTDITKKTYLMPRYSQGNPLQRSIMHVIVYEAFNASGGISTPGSSTSTGTPQTPPQPAAPTSGGPYARVKADVTWGLNIRSSIDTSSTRNIVTVAAAGSLLTLLEADGESKVGAVNQWVRVRDANGREGYAAAWYLEKVPAATPAPAPVTSPTSTPEAAPQTPSTPEPALAPTPAQFMVAVKATVGKLGLNVYEKASLKSAILSNEKVRTKLVVLENEAQARAKLNKAGKWVNVQASNGESGFVQADKVKLP